MKVNERTHVVEVDEDLLAAALVGQLLVRHARGAVAAVQHVLEVRHVVLVADVVQLVEVVVRAVRHVEKVPQVLEHRGEAVVLEQLLHGLAGALVQLVRLDAHEQLEVVGQRVGDAAVELRALGAAVGAQLLARGDDGLEGLDHVLADGVAELEAVVRALEHAFGLVGDQFEECGFAFWFGFLAVL